MILLYVFRNDWMGVTRKFQSAENDFLRKFQLGSSAAVIDVDDCTMINKNNKKTAKEMRFMW